MRTHVRRDITISEELDRMVVELMVALNLRNYSQALRIILGSSLPPAETVRQAQQVMGASDDRSDSETT